MSFLLNRKIIGLFTFFISSIVFFLFYREAQANLISTGVYSGFLLFFLVFFLALYNVRKALPFLPLGKSATWLQLHIYIGLISISVFSMHINFRIPNGFLEILVAALFLIVAISGIIGLFLSRVLPKRLTARGESIIYEEIPILRKKLRERVEKIVLDSIVESKKTTIADFYAYRLANFFIGPKFFWFHIFGSMRHLIPFYTNLDGVRRYLSNKELEILAEIEKCVKEKDDLDFQSALQFLLKYWLFLHIPLTYSLIIFAAFHGVLAMKFVGG